MTVHSHVSLSLERRNIDDQKVHPPFQNNMVDETEEVDEIEMDDPDQEINHLEYESSRGYLTKSGY